MPIGIGTAVQVGGAALSALGSANAERQAAASQAAASQAAAAGVSQAKDTLSYYKSRLGKNDQIYGRLERNRARILDDITPAKIEAGINQRNKKFFQQAREQVKTNAALRGLGDKSGLTRKELFDLTIAEAAAGAEAQLSSESRAIDILTGGITPGLQREQQLTQSIGGASNAAVSAYGTQASTNLNIAGQQLQSAKDKGSTAGTILGLGGDGQGFASLVGNLNKAVSFGGA